VAVVDGKELLPRNVTGGKMLTQSYRFAAPKAKIEKIIYREGRVETVRLKNVSLHAGERTNVSGLPATLTFPVQFSDGSIVEILGITDPKLPGKWWTANGLPATMPALPAGGMSSGFPAGNQPQRKVVVRMTGNVADKSLALRFDGSGGGATFSTTDGKTLMLEHVSSLSKPLKTTTLGLYKSSGPYRVDETFTVGGDAATQASGRIRSVTEEAGKVKVKLRVPGPSPHRDEHVAVVLKDGRELRASQMSSSSEEAQMAWHVFDCTLDQVVRVVIKSREMESADMKNISLDPTQPPTAIIVHRALPPTGKAP
jgi:hypothetical protein